MDLLIYDFSYIATVALNPLASICGWLPRKKTVLTSGALPWAIGTNWGLQNHRV